jgi:hypothetical protein
MFNLEFTREDITKALEAMAGNCRPPYPSDAGDLSIREIVNDVFALDPKTGKPKKRKHKAEHLCHLFNITAEVADKLELRTIIPDELKAERKKNRPPTQREIDKERRLDALRQLVGIFGKGFGCRKYVQALADMDIKTNRQTVNVDLRSIGYELPKQGKTKKGVRE